MNHGVHLSSAGIALYWPCVLACSLGFFFENQRYYEGEIDCANAAISYFGVYRKPGNDQEKSEASSDYVGNFPDVSSPA